jgi:prophage regulatory protein
MSTNPENTLIRLKQVQSQTGIARSTIYKLLALNRFPQPIKITDRAIAWPQKAINDWVALQISKSEI